MSAAPSRSEASEPALSVIVPVFNGAAHLGACLAALGAESGQAEVLVVDDGSTDASAEVGADAGARVLRLAHNLGAAGARNRGAAAARAPLLVFVDADVSVHPGTLARLRERFDAERGIDALFGSYDDAPSAPGVVSRYRNLLHHHTHQGARREATTFWTGLGAVRRAAFDAVGGFDEHAFARCGMEDVELGERLHRAGRRIVLDPDLQCTHHKAWTLVSMVRTDVLHRALPWCRLILTRGFAPNDLNLRLGQRLCVMLALAFWPLLALAVLVSPLWGIPALACWVGIIALEHRLFALFLRLHGVGFTLACAGLHLLFHTYSGLACVYAVTRWQWQRVAPSPGRRQARVAEP